MKTKYFLFIIILILTNACKNEDKCNTKQTIQHFKIGVSFPDTVYLNKPYNGKINYKNDLDTITTQLLQIKKARFIQYAFLKTKTIDYDNAYLKSIAIDTLYTNSNRFIPLSAISFDKVGVNYIDGIITDEVIIETGKKTKNGLQETRVITNEFRVTHKVVVIDKK